MTGPSQVISFPKQTALRRQNSLMHLSSVGPLGKHVDFRLQRVYHALDDVWLRVGTCTVGEAIALRGTGIQECVDGVLDDRRLALQKSFRGPRPGASSRTPRT